MAKKKKKFWFFKNKKLTKAEKKQRSSAVKTTLVIFAFIMVLVAIGVGFIFLDGYVRTDMAGVQKDIEIELADLPTWASAELKEKIILTAIGQPKDLKPTEATAMRVGENLESLVWLHDVRVHVDNRVVTINAKYRKPVGVIASADGDYFIANDMVILDYVEVNKLPMIKIIGTPAHLLSWRSVGTKWNSDDVTAAVELLTLLDSMDKRVVPDKPLLSELRSIDVSNFNGRRSSSQSHIVFYAKDGTEIRWGTQVGAWQRHLEARDEEKLTLLYNTYQELGSVCLKSAQRGSFIDLRKPQNLALPIDRY